VAKIEGLIVPVTSARISPISDTTNGTLTRLLVTLAAAVVVLAGLRAATSVIGPVAIALLITIAWSPASRWLQRRGWHPTVASLMGTIVGATVVALLVLLIYSSVLQLESELPTYQERIGSLRDSVTDLLARLPFDVDGSQLASAEALQPEAIVGYAVGFLGGLTNTAGTLAILLLLMVFMMIEGVRYPQKLRAAFRASEASAARLDGFVTSMRSYVVINTIFGLIAGVANTLLLLALGVDLAILWGVLSFLLSFLPNIGFVLALAPPALLALLQFGVGRALLVVAGFSVINLVIDNVIKPRYVGESLDLSPAVVVISLVFWGWLMGPVGALLAVPFSIAARLLLEGHEEARWIGHLMSDAGGEDTPA
jgi:predicted PurR-regulated permease PerM